MKEENYKGNEIKIIIISATVIFLATIITFTFFIMNKLSKMEKDIYAIHNSVLQVNNNAQDVVDTSNTSKNLDNNNTDSSSSSSYSKIKVYTLKLENQIGTIKDFALDEDYTIHTEIANYSANQKSIKFNVNSNENVFEDGLFFSDSDNDDENSFTFKFYRVGDYLVYTNHDSTDVRSTHVYFIDKNGNLYKELYQFDELNEGLVGNKVEFNDNTIIINATRITHGPEVIYNNMRTSNSKDVLNKIPKDAIVEATYTYSLNSDGSIDLDNPSVEAKSTFQDFIDNNKDILNDEAYYN